MKKIIIVETIAFAFLALLIFTEWLDISWSTKTILSSCQPAEIDYKSFDPYCISTIKQQQTLEARYFILVAKKAEPSYGHVLNYPAPAIASEKDLQNTNVKWTTDGIEIQTYLNTKIFIPKENFTGGR